MGLLTINQYWSAVTGSLRSNREFAYQAHVYRSVRKRAQIATVRHQINEFQGRVLGHASNSPEDALTSTKFCAVLLSTRY